MTQPPRIYLLLGFSLLVALSAFCRNSMEPAAGMCADEMPIGHEVPLFLNFSGIDTLPVQIQLNQTDTICASDLGFSDLTDTMFLSCGVGSLAAYAFIHDTCLVLRGDWVGEETVCLVGCDADGLCDTTILEVQVMHPLGIGITDTIVPSQKTRFCFDESQLNIQGPVTSLLNLCLPSPSGPVAFTLDLINDCLNYTGKFPGVDTACIRLCDAFGNCDTVQFFISVVPGQLLSDTVFIQVDTGSYCLDPSILPGNITHTGFACGTANGGRVEYSVNERCVSWVGKEAGVDTVCIRFQNDPGEIAFAVIIVNVVQPVPARVSDTIFINQLDTYCLDRSDLPGEVTLMEEICPDDASGNVIFLIDPIEYCIRYQGVEEGSDSLCIRLCDDLGFCDTTYFHIHVSPYLAVPSIYPDTAGTSEGTPVVIDFLRNDTIFGGVQDVFILNPPISGVAVINLDQSVTYTPDEPFCARWDQFTYVACNPNGCDTTSVHIFIECVELKVFNAVSPNNDNVNDYFYIARIEDFPDNRLLVYNRWGILVFEKESYQNDWPGRWGNDIDLPDGTYFYILEWNESGETKIQRGYFELFR